MSTSQAAPAVAYPSIVPKFVALNLIHPSPWNPRKAFEGIDDLAASMAENGQLQAGTARPRPGGKPDEVELMGGERRFRALKKIKAAGMWLGIREATDADARAIQLVENLQREDISILDQARGFAELQDSDPKTWTPDAIAKSVSKTPRFVQQRLAIHRNLRDDLKKQMVAGEITVEAARTIAMAPRDMQEQIASNSYTMQSADRIREAILSRVIPVASAEFPVEQYTGDTIDKQGRKQFVDVGQFMKLQGAVMQSRAEALKGEWPKVKIIQSSETYDWSWSDTGTRLFSSPDRGKAGTSKVPHEKQTAVLWIAGNGKINQALGVVAATTISATVGASSGGGHSGPPRESADHRRARLGYLTDVRAAIAKDGDLGLHLVVAGLLCGRVTIGYDHGALRKCGDVLPEKLKRVLDQTSGDSRDVKAWEAAKSLTLSECMTVLAAFAGCTVTWQNHEDKPRPLAVALGKTVGVAVKVPEKKAKKKVPKAKAKKTAPKKAPAAKKPAAKKKAAPKAKKPAVKKAARKAKAKTGKAKK